ncbi:MAG: hypothetical protein KA536_15515 [Saprospiraceae bacterium]|nr:hypothetical protein [Saprospiraceae bacterium]
MFGFFKKNKKQKPDWSPFDSVEVHDEFESSVSEYFKSKNIEHQIIDGIVNIPNNDFGLNELGLLNIAQYCKNEGQKKFNEHISGHFETLIRGYEFSKYFDSIKVDYNKVKQYIGVRLYNQSNIEQVGLEKTIGKSLGANIYAMLIYDLPDTVTSVPPREAEIWNISKEELWDRALENTHTNYPPNILNRELQGISFKTVEEDHFFSPNIVFNLSEYPELIGAKGSLISMPTRHIVIIYPIYDLKVLNALNTQIQVTNGVSSKGPGTLSNGLFWYFNGELKEQLTKIEDGNLVFKPTDDFVSMLNQMKQ